jgi:hypothetical protein
MFQNKDDEIEIKFSKEVWGEQGNSGQVKFDSNRLLLLLNFKITLVVKMYCNQRFISL